MKVQEINTSKGSRYILLDDSYRKVDEACRYLKYLDACGKSPNTLRSYAYHLKLYFEYCSTNKIDIKTVFANNDKKAVDILSGFLLWLQYPETSSGVTHISPENPIRSNRTVNIIMTAVLSFYDFLASNGEIEEPTIYKTQRTFYHLNSFLSELVHHEAYQKRSLLKKQEPKNKLEKITRQEYCELLTHCHCRRDQLLLAFLFEGGLRLSEALGIHLADLTQIEEGVVKITPRENNENHTRVKNYARGVVKYPDYVIDLLLTYLTEDIIDYKSDYLFLTLQGENKGKALTPAAVEKLFQRLSREVGWKVHPHMLRHGFATEKLEAGWQMVDIQAYLRHVSIHSTEIYATYSDELKKEKIRGFFEKNADRMKEVADAIR